MSTQHGWTTVARKETEAVADINDEHGGLIALCDASFAPLFTMAPELLMLVKAYKQDLEGAGMNDGPAYRAVCAAIDKATGNI